MQPVPQGTGLGVAGVAVAQGRERVREHAAEPAAQVAQRCE